MYLALALTCEDLIKRPENANGCIKTFTEPEIAERLQKMPKLSILLKHLDATQIKYLVLALRKQFHVHVVSGSVGKWMSWLKDAKDLAEKL